MSRVGCRALKGVEHNERYPPMTSFTFSIEQVRSAPPEVRRWIEHEITAAFAALNKSEHDPSQIHAAALAACMPQEAAQLFEMIKNSFLLSQVFSNWPAICRIATARRRSIRSASPISYVTHGLAMAIGSSIASQRSIKRFRRSAMIR